MSVREDSPDDGELVSGRVARAAGIDFALSLVLGFAAAALAAAGLLGPVAGALVHIACSAVIIANPALLLKGGEAHGVRNCFGSSLRADRLRYDRLSFEEGSQ